MEMLKEAEWKKNLRIQVDFSNFAENFSSFAIFGFDLFSRVSLITPGWPWTQDPSAFLC